MITKSGKLAVLCSIAVLMSATWTAPAQASNQLGPKDVYVVDDSGTPLTGGVVSWRMKDGSARSARSYGLTADGLITFPYAPTGAAILRIAGAILASGDTISGNYNITLNSGGARLQVATAPPHVRSVEVVGPDGGGVAGAVVRLPDSCDAQVWDPNAGDWIEGYYDDASGWVDGSYTGAYVEGRGETNFTTAISNDWGDYEFNNASDHVYFTNNYDTAGYEATTDSSGVARFWGYADKSDCTEVSVEYNDGIVIQSVKGQLGSSVTLPYVPVVTISTDDIDAHEGAAVNIPVAVAMPSGSGLRGNFEGLLAPARTGVQTTVSVKLPKGATRGHCGAKLKAKTNRSGKATLRICATASGLYRIQAKGSFRTSGVMVRVSGAPSTPVTSVTVRSKSPGTVSASWNSPAYLGGARLLGYQILVKQNGTIVRRINISAGRKSTTIRGLKNAQTYTVLVTAKTRNGVSQPVTKSVGVV